MNEIKVMNISDLSNILTPTKYIKIIEYTEAFRSFIQISKSARDMFPRIMEDFTLKYKNKEYTVRIDKLGRLWINGLRIFLKEGDKVIITKESLGIYSLYKE